MTTEIKAATKAMPPKRGIGNVFVMVKFFCPGKSPTVLTMTLQNESDQTDADTQSEQTTDCVLCQFLAENIHFTTHPAARKNDMLLHLVYLCWFLKVKD